MGGGPPLRIPPYIGVVDKKRGDNPVNEILGKNYWEVGVPPSLSVPPPVVGYFTEREYTIWVGTYGYKKYRSGT